MKIAVIGLGLMGASLAGALRGFRDALLTGADKDPAVCRKAQDAGIVDAAYDDPREAVRGASLVIFCVYAAAIPPLLRRCAPALAQGAILSDLCGVKGELYTLLPALLPSGVDYVGIHPMAGKERGGFDNASSDLFRGCGFIISPLPSTQSTSVELMRAVAEWIGAAKIKLSAPAEHDALVAYSSGLTHLSAAALCLDMPKDLQPAFTGGAWRDGTRVAEIDAEGWTALLMENRAASLDAIERYINSLCRYRDALRDSDAESLRLLLETAGKHKRELGKG